MSQITSPNPNDHANDATTTSSATPNASTPPRWDMTAFYPSLDSPEFQAAFVGVKASIAELGNLFDRLDIRGLEESPAISAGFISGFEEAVARYNNVLEEMRVVRGYISAFVATDSRNATAQARGSELRKDGVALGLLSTRFTAWLGSLDVEALIAQSEVAFAHAYYLREAKVAATHLLNPGEEELSAELSLSGSSAWAKLHGDITSQLTVTLPGAEGEAAQELPMSVIRALASDSDREVRRRAYEAEIAAWEKAALPLAAAMNGIKHETNTLTKRRGWGEPLDAACFNNHIDRETLDAMLSAAQKSFPDFRRYLRAKAKYLSGDAKLPWYDLFAPVGASTKTWEWPEATAFVAEQFGEYSPKMRAFAERTFTENWIDAEPRPGKRDGAFCMGVRKEESRIMQNYKPAFGGVSTLAHELGHGYHNLCLAERTPLQKGTPMTLAETASIFCETIIREAALTAGNKEEQLAILEASIQGSAQVVVDITSRFLFEKRVLEARKERELSVQEFCEVMRQAQLDTYGDGLDDNFLHPYMWAVKGHYYGSTFYNYPYMFGLLFGLGLYAQYQKDPEPFRARYDDLLSSTGMDDAATLAGRFGIDLRDEAFWTASLDLIREDIRRFEDLLA
jgi:oligoendopeptidase F